MELRTGTLVLVESMTGTLVLVESMTGTLVLVEDRNSPTGPVPHSGADSFDCSAVTGNDKDFLR